MKICDVPQCGRKVHSHGYCSTHATRFIRHGDPLGGGVARKRGTPIERFWNHVDRTDGCWLWTGGTYDFGYGKFNPSPGVVVRAHRWLYEREVGPIPIDLELDHTCGHPPCVRPSHLEPVTHRVNVRRGRGWAGRNARKTHCPKGHPYSPENTRRQRTRNGGRVCIACQNERSTK